MKKVTIFSFAITLIFFVSDIFAQLPEDALRTAWFAPNGTARINAIGGAVGSLGGDISSNNSNPAGIGLYKTKELVLSPGLVLNNNRIDYRGTNTSSNGSGLIYGPSGIVLGSVPNNRYSKWTSTAFSFSINQLASYSNHTYYKGGNDMSSFSEQYLEELTRDGADISAALSNYIFGSSLAFRTYLVDSFNVAGQLAGYRSLVPVKAGIQQERDQKTSGGYHEISFGFAGNMSDKMYLGASVNVPIVSYTSDLWFKESDLSGNPDNDFNNFQFNEHSTSNGLGLNVKLGLIYKPQQNFRFGIALHSPSFIGFKDRIRADMLTDTEGYAGVQKASSDELNSGNPGERVYNLLTPWRAILSGSFVFGGQQNIKQQKGFISADIEYVNYKGARFSTSDQGDFAGKNYYTSLNDVLRDYYKGAINARLGGELKFNFFAFRAGAAYYGSPYSDAVLKANLLSASTGIGYRNHGYFIDLSYTQFFNKDVNFPYRLNDMANTFAAVKNNKSKAMLTIGFKL